jgi:glycosyltransferase involved in cell wall biosynthesis
MARVLLDPALRLRLAAGARERAKAYSWHRVGEAIAALYAELVQPVKV